MFEDIIGPDKTLRCKDCQHGEKGWSQYPCSECLNSRAKGGDPFPMFQDRDNTRNTDEAKGFSIKKDKDTDYWHVEAHFGNRYCDHCDEWVSIGHRCFG